MQYLSNRIIDNLCPLCKNKGNIFYKDEFFLCTTCFGIFKKRSLYPSIEKEKERYELHNNDVNNLKYQKFVSPITSLVFEEYSPQNKGLDFGAGTGPVISKILKDKGYNISLYDPFFHNNPELLKKNYDYIICCEVIEHFHNPEKEFILLKELLNDNGTLYCMTQIYNQDISFKKWYYKEDFTHVFFYQKETIRWIKVNFGFSSFSVNEKVIKFKK